MWNRDVVKDPRAFATIVEADGIFAIGQPGHNSAAEEALQVDDPVEVMGADLTQTRPGFVPANRRSPPVAVERDDPGQVGIAFEQRNQSTAEPPINLAGGQ